MRQTWRWFGPTDIATIADIAQAGAEGVVSALHHVPNGTVWSPDEIARRKLEIATHPDGSPSGISWDVVESVPVSEDIKKQRGDWRPHLEAYRQTLRNLAAAGIEVVCYNFMPVLDWTRTDLAWRLPNGGTCMRFDYADFAVFDIHLLGRPDAAADYPEDLREEAAARFKSLNDDAASALTRNIVAGLPGANERLSLADVQAHLDQYRGIGPDRLRQNLFDFLDAVVPTAEEVGIRLCCHPDDPPFPLLGLPRVMSTEADYRQMLDAVPSAANGMTFCTGSLGARPDNDLPGIVERLADRIHFLHLRNVHRDSAAIAGSFHESEHLGGDIDMVAVIAAIVREESRRKAEGRADHQIPMRPDHGQDIVDDLRRRSQPGYPIIGRLKGLAELRGVTKALEHARYGVR